MDILKYSKAIVPVGVAVILAVLAKVGVTPDMSVQDTIALIITAGLVWFVPNKTK